MGTERKKLFFSTCPRERLKGIAIRYRRTDWPDIDVNRNLQYLVTMGPFIPRREWWSQFPRLQIGTIGAHPGTKENVVPLLRSRRT